MGLFTGGAFLLMSCHQGLYPSGPVTHPFLSSFRAYKYEARVSFFEITVKLEERYTRLKREAELLRGITGIKNLSLETPQETGERAILTGFLVQVPDNKHTGSRPGLQAVQTST